MFSLSGTTVLYDSTTNTGLILRGIKTDSGEPAATASVYAVGAEITNVISGIVYKNSGTSLSPTWQNADEISTSEIADGAITAAKVRGTEARTATADGLTTGAITTPTTYISVITVTSAAATDAITLPAISSATIGQIIYLNVGANGYELLTPASSTNLINLVDSDGTNQLDVAASTTVRCTQVTAAAWLAETVAATTIAVTAPDND